MDAGGFFRVTFEFPSPLLRIIIRAQVLIKIVDFQTKQRNTLRQRTFLQSST